MDITAHVVFDEDDFLDAIDAAFEDPDHESLDNLERLDHPDREPAVSAGDRLRLTRSRRRWRFAHWDLDRADTSACGYGSNFARRVATTLSANARMISDKFSNQPVLDGDDPDMTCSEERSHKPCNRSWLATLSLFGCLLTALIAGSPRWLPLVADPEAEAAATVSVIPDAVPQPSGRPRPTPGVWQQTALGAVYKWPSSLILRGGLRWDWYNPYRSAQTGPFNEGHYDR